MNKECNNESCNTGSVKPSQASDCCPIESCDCPIEAAEKMWKSAFFEALTEVKKEALKERIRKAWGANIDKSADAVIETMGTIWQAKLTSGKAKYDLKEKLARILTEGKK